MNKKINEAIKILSLFDRDNQFYWLKAYKGLSISEKGFIIGYLGLNQ